MTNILSSYFRRKSNKYSMFLSGSGRSRGAYSLAMRARRSRFWSRCSMTAAWVAVAVSGGEGSSKSASAALTGAVDALVAMDTSSGEGEMVLPTPPMGAPADMDDAAAEMSHGGGMLIGDDMVDGLD